MAGHGFAEADSESGVPVASGEPDPAEAVALAEGAEELLRALGEEELQRIAQLALEGFTNAEIGSAIGKSVAAVERKLRRIRDVWAARGAG